jgi:hypothetical protein
MICLFCLLAARVRRSYCLEREDTQDTNKFNPFLQSAEDDAHNEVARGPADHHRPSDDERATLQKTGCQG